MKKLIILILSLIISLIILLPAAGWGTDYYIDPDAGSDGVGTFADPYNTWTGKTISTGHDYRQLCGTTWTGNMTEITNSGASDNYIIIGAYYDDSGVAHEDDDPSMGTICGNSAAKPIITDSDFVGNTISIDANYVELNSISVRKGSNSVRIAGDYNRVWYCYIFDSYFSIRVGLAGDVQADYNNIAYTIMDGNETVDAGPRTDCLNFNVVADNNTAHNLTFDNCDHSAVMLYGGDNNTVYDFYVKDTNSVMSEAINFNYDSDNNHVYNFWSNDGILQIAGGSGNAIHNFVFSGGGEANFGHLEITTAGGDNHSNNDNKIYNGVFKPDGVGRGILIYAASSKESWETKGNEIANIIIFAPPQNCIRVADNSDIIDSSQGADSNRFYNIDCYDSGNATYAQIEGINYADPANLNTRSDASGNNEDDPQLEDSDNDEFWPSSESSNVIDNGYDVGALYDDYWINTSDPPNLIFNTQKETTHDIGAYTLIEENPAEISGLELN